MGFVKDAARGGLFGIAGHLLAKDKDKKDRPPPSLITAGGRTESGASLIGNQQRPPHVY